MQVPVGQTNHKLWDERKDQGDQHSLRKEFQPYALWCWAVFDVLNKQQL